MSCPSAMSPPAIWPPHSSKQIFEAGIRTRCHAYLNDQAGGSHQHSPWGWLRRGLGGRTRAGLEGRPSHLGLRLQPHIRSSLGTLRESKSRLEKKNKSKHTRVDWHSSNLCCLRISYSLLLMKIGILMSIKQRKSSNCSQYLVLKNRKEKYIIP